jgi:Winged helix DNA-binding domain
MATEHALRTVTYEQVLGRRLARNHLLERAPATALPEVVRDVCGLQAQVLVAAELGASARVEGLDQSAIREELWARHRIVKTVGLRGTLHLFASDELGLWCAALRAPAARRGRRWTDQWDVSPKQADALIAAVTDALEGRVLTRAKLAEEAGRRLGRWVEKRLASQWGELLSLPMCAGTVCFGPNEGAQVTFARTDEWLGAVEEHDPEEALLEVLRRFLHTYGPARPQDFATWFAPGELKASDARELLQALGDEVEEVRLERTRGWLLAADAADEAASAEAEVAPLRLLPQYDCYYLGCRLGRESIFSGDVKKRAPIKMEGPVQLSWVVAQGAAIGYWERQKRANRVELRVELFRSLGRHERQELAAEVARIGAFYDLTPALDLSEP